MSSHSLSLAALLSLCVCLTVGKAVTELLLEVTSVSGEDCSLLCTAEAKPGVQYRALKWYKQVEETPVSRVSGLLTRDLPDGPTRWFTSVDREVELQAESRSIFLPNVTCSDSGVYICHLAAPVGEQNREGRVLLTLTDCAHSSTELLTDTYLVIFASAVLMLALLIFLISYACLKNITKERSKTTKKHILLNAPLKPLEKKNLKLIYTLGPKTSTMEHVCV